MFPSGVYAAGGVEMVKNFEKSKGDLVIQQADKFTGLPLWVVEASGQILSAPRSA